MTRVAVIGGRGFIGTATCRELTDAGCEVVVMDLKRPTIPVTGVEYKVVDVNSYIDTLQALGSSKFDYVYMLAAISDAYENVREPLKSININILGLTNVLQAVSVLKIPRIIFSSTVWVYSASELTYVNEDTDLNLTKSDHIYTTSKLTGEALVKHYHSITGINYTILRYGIAYGPGCHPDTVLSRFMTNAINNEPLVITGNGSIYRNFLNVKDHARGNMLAMNHSAKNQIINLEGPEKITLVRVAERVRDLHGDVDIVYTDQRSGDYTGKVVSNRKSKEILGWEPAVSFNDGTADMYSTLLHK
jgi:UDP-glucose 4-epimerase